MQRKHPEISGCFLCICSCNQNLYSHTNNSHWHIPRDRHHDNRDNDLLLVGISCAPAVAGMLATMPLWLFRHLHNRVIHMLALLILFVTLVGCLLIVIARENPGIGFAAIAVSSINFFLFRHYERLLYTLRCPGCRHATLRIRSVHNRTYRLYCKRCGLYTYWRE